jgi:hypothetical protein
LKIKGPGRDADKLPSSSVEINIAWMYTFTMLRTFALRCLNKQLEFTSTLSNTTTSRKSISGDITVAVMKRGKTVAVRGNTASSLLVHRHYHFHHG